MLRPFATTRSTGRAAPSAPRPVAPKLDSGAIAPTTPTALGTRAQDKTERADLPLDAEDRRPTGNVEMKATQMTPQALDEVPTMSSPRFYRAGDVIDAKYRLEGLIGKGGMGEVWTAHNETLGVLRALKLIPADLDSPESTDRLLHEARAAARLADPAIVRVFDFGKTPWGDPYLVMELLSGEDLASVIRRRERLSASKAVRVLLPILRALCAAHAHGIVHRDLKPENIFLSKLPDARTQPKLLDFGIAKLKNARALRLTTDGTVIGSPLYMSPEQARGDEVDERTDVWAVCVVLYEVIAGTPPFMGADRREVIQAAASANPLSLLSHGIQEEDLWHILEQGLGKRPDQRWPSMHALGEALARWLLARNVFDDITGASVEAAWLRKAPSSILNSLPPPELMKLPEVVIKEVDDPREGVWVTPLERLRGAIDLERFRRAYAVFEGRTTTRSRLAIGAGLTLALLAVVGFAWPSGEAKSSPPSSSAPLTPETTAAAAKAAAPALEAPPREARAPETTEPEAPAPAPSATTTSTTQTRKPSAHARETKPKKPVAKRRDKLLNPFHQ